MSALLVYRNSTPEVMAWAEGFKARTSEIGSRRTKWMDAFYSEHAPRIPDNKRGTFSRGNVFSGVMWPERMDPPKGWRRPSYGDARLIIPDQRYKVGKAAVAAMDALAWPDARRELSQQHGMRSFATTPLAHYWTPGVAIEDDGVWITWGSRDVAPELGDVESHGWARVPLVEYIERFGEDAL